MDVALDKIHEKIRTEKNRLDDEELGRGTPALAVIVEYDYE